MNPKIKKLAAFLVLNNFIEESNQIISGSDFISEKDIEDYTFELGDRSREIEKAKQQLFDLGYYYGKINPDFDIKLQKALKKYEIKNNIQYNGNLSIGTLVKLDIDHSLNIKNPYGLKRSLNKEYDKSEALKEFSEWSVEGTSTGSGSNFHRIGDSTNYRSAQPPISKEFFEFIREYGIENILNLRGNISMDGISEDKAVSDAGLNYISIPLGDKPPSTPDWDTIKSLLDSGNTLVHCQHGADRTGSVIARWEVESGLKNPKEAYNDSKKYGFKLESFKGYFLTKKEILRILIQIGI